MAVLKILISSALGLFFFAAGANHFLNPAFYLHMMPAYLPWHLPLVRISGAAEAGLGLLLLIPICREPAGWGLIALLLAVFPANINMAAHPDRYPQFQATALWLRLPLQFVLMALIHWCSRPPDGSAARRGK